MGHSPKHGLLTNPGKHAELLHDLPDDVATLLTITRRHFVHDAYLELHDIDTSDFSSISRETLPLETRLDRILANSRDPIAVPRAASQRQVGTCRDYAVMLCGFLREKLIPARVRCGFAGYFSVGRYEDHWLCEYWLSEENRWARADAQLDREHRRRLGIAFDTSDVPAHEFMTAAEAWRACRSHAANPEKFGHGEATGERFLWVDLARDYLSLNGQEASRWDGWRETFPCERGLNRVERHECDRIALAIGGLETRSAPGNEQFSPTPFWKRAG